MFSNLLSDEFVQFSARIAELQAQKKTVTEAFQEAYKEYKATIAELEAKAKELAAAFEASDPAKNKKIVEE